MNFVEQLLTRRVEQLEADSKKLDLVREWANGLRRGLDNLGPDLTANGDEFIDVDRFKYLESLLGPDQAAK
ncbi:MAG: hypothetical protein A2Z77_00515 [Chloroflexi bacterium RBG_13_51_36]|nr:MAG: hypothetical protein A2Z77_00515 [Chloroflexi bacterium RBG_13_51_36]